MSEKDNKPHFDDIPDEPFQGFAPENLGDKEWRLIKNIARKKLDECEGNYAKACVLAYFDFLDIVTEIPFKHH